MQLMHDFVIGTEKCNLRCEYCMSQESPFKDENTKKTSNLHANAKQVLGFYRRYFDTPILKLSGGEILLIENIIDLITKESKFYETVIILTNGTISISRDMLTRLKNLGNIQFQVSLDGHLFEMNSYRYKSNKILKFRTFFYVFLCQRCTLADIFVYYCKSAFYVFHFRYAAFSI